MKLAFYPFHRQNLTTTPFGLILKRRFPPRGAIRRLRTVFLSVCVFAAAVFLPGCGGQSTGGPSTISTPVSSEAASPSVSGSAGAAAESSSPAASVPSSAADGGYALPASSGGTGASSDAGTAASRGADSSAQPQAQSSAAEDSQPLFRSVFSSSPESGENPDAPDNSGPKISESEYDRIQEGMTYSEAKGIIGSDGALQREFGEKGSSLYTVEYRWAGTASGSYADLTFEGGTLSFKIQAGLQ